MVGLIANPPITHLSLHLSPPHLITHTIAHSIHRLIGQYLALRKPQAEPHMVGLVSTQASPFDIAQQAITDAAYMCTRTHGDAPEVGLPPLLPLHYIL